VGTSAELFVERGYVPTTIDAIAERAGVGRKTIFTSVGGKVALLKLAFDWALSGDDEPVAIADRPEVRRMMEAEDPNQLLDAWIEMNARIAQRVAALHQVLVVAADSDPEAADLLATTDDQRIAGARVIIGRIAALGGLREDLDVARAADIADVLIDPMPFRRLVGTRRWSFKSYVAVLQRIASESILR
jgi:AcrR family transcriptional regulator